MLMCDIYIAVLSVCLSVRPSICLSHSDVVLKHILILSSAYDSPIILVFLVLNIFAKFQ